MFCFVKVTFENDTLSNSGLITLKNLSWLLTFDIDFVKRLCRWKGYVCVCPSITNDYSYQHLTWSRISWYSLLAVLRKQGRRRRSCSYKIHCWLQVCMSIWLRKFLVCCTLLLCCAVCVCEDKLMEWVKISVQRGWRWQHVMTPATSDQSTTTVSLRRVFFPRVDFIIYFDCSLLFTHRKANDGRHWRWCIVGRRHSLALWPAADNDVLLPVRRQILSRRGFFLPIPQFPFFRNVAEM